MSSISNQHLILLIAIGFAAWRAYNRTLNRPQPIVQLKYGLIQGIERAHYFAFEGIPYAQPPVGAKRFEPPEPYKETWSDIFDATKPGPMCMQWDHFKFEEADKLSGSENCLYLNVYTSNFGTSAKQPVLVHIHGGAFMFGEGAYYGPEILTTLPIVYVNFNYRLGPLGFLSTESKLVPGNMGLKDQTVALRWIKENIEHFGGDPENIIITGFSAGGASVHLHYLSPLSKRLFSRGISHSGCALNPWVFMENALEKTMKIADTLGCPTHPEGKMIECLRKQPAEAIVRTVSLFQPFLYNPFSPFAAVVEPKHAGAFIIEKPIDLIKARKIQPVPWIASATEAEGLYPGAEFMRREEYLPQIDREWDELASVILDFNYTIAQDRKTQVARAIKKHYLGNRGINKESFQDLIKIISDRLYKHGLAKAVKLQSSFMNVYFYHFLYKTQYGDGEEMSQKLENYGVSHGEDILLCYSTTDYRGVNRPYSKEEKQVQKMLLDMYMSFATNAVPLIKEFEFPSSDSEVALRYISIRGVNNIVVEEDVNYGEEKFWDELGLQEN